MTGEKNNKNEEKSPSELEQISKSYRTGWAYAELAFQYGIAIILCTLIGFWLDNWLDTGHVLMITGVVIGTVFGFIGLLKSLNQLNKKNSGNKQKNG
jgi:F0F1-type ATP synthase assembly protein I